ncbi:calcium-binding protein [Vandammella animalimorsus]|uniref:calcium-binding protein n=1 Tax=Vandammella animalimorsus TaxID=2029117 RepID=UPI0031BAF4DD
MNAIKIGYINALLADASYVTVQPGMTEAKLLDATKDRLTTTQAAYLAANFEVVSSIESPRQLGSGFDAVVWRVKADSPLAMSEPEMAGRLFVSMRGTQEAEDFADDAALASSGVPSSQIVDMVNWWLRITTEVGAVAPQIARVLELDSTALIIDYVAAVPAPGEGLIAAADMARGIAVNGHSLGGYLSTAFARLFGDQAVVQDIHTFNSAGFSNVAASNINRHYDQIASLLNLSGSFAAVGTIQTNYFGENGIEVTTNSLGDIRLPGFNQYGTRVPLYQESVLSGGVDFMIANHYMYKLTDYLALGAALEKLDSSLSFDQLNQLVMAGSNEAKAGYEGVLDAVRKFIDGANVMPLAADDVSGNATTREGFHAALKALQESDAFQSLVGKVTFNPIGGNLAAQGKARVDFQSFVALYTLSPFVLNPAGAAGQAALDALWATPAWQELYQQWLSDKTHLATGQAQLNFTDQWYEDRAVLLHAIHLRNRQDQDTVVADAAAPGDRMQAFKWLGAAPLPDELLPRMANLTYRNIKSERPVPIQRIIFGANAQSTLEGNDVEGIGDHLYGGTEDDALFGYKGDDYLEGGAGNDELNGGDGSDQLLGGSGTDTYVFEGDWGIDTIIEADGLGGIVVGAETLNGGEQIAAGTWESENGKWRYTLTQAGDLLITPTDKPGRIIVRDWERLRQATDKPLGLDLRSAQQQPGPAPNPEVYALQGGYFIPGSQRLPNAPWQLQADGSIAGLAPLPNTNDLMVGGQDSLTHPGAYERIGGYDGQNFVIRHARAVDLRGLGGNDFISGEQYDDRLDGGEGDDLIWGGAGSDVILGGAGNDVIVSNMAATHVTDAAEGAVPQGYVRGPDTVISHAGGPENAQGRWWIETSTDGNALRIQRAYVKNPEGGYTYWAESASDQDFVDAGDGDDYVWGGRGADNLIGGNGADHLAGLGGADVLLGGAGEDKIYGDSWSAMRLSASYKKDQQAYYVGELPLDEALKSPTLHGDDVIDAGAGDDQVWGDGGNDLIQGGSGNDILIGDADITELAIEYHGNDTLEGGAGNDRLFGLGKDDVLRGGAGDDELQGDAVKYHGDDALDGGAGNDRLFGQGGNDAITGGAGNDVIEADGALSTLDAQFHGNDSVDGGEGDDSIAGGGGDDTLYGGAGNDWIAGEDETEVTSVSALTGNDSIHGGGGNDTLVGGNGNDELFGDEGDDWLYGGAGSDRLEGGTGRNVLKGGAGDDTYVTSSDGIHIIADGEGDNIVQDAGGLAVSQTPDGDLVLTSANRTVVIKEAMTGGFMGRLQIGSELLTLSEFLALSNGSDAPPSNAAPTDNDDVLYGDLDNNMIDGRAGNDRIYGLDGNDRLIGGSGDDVIDGGAGDDTLIDGLGNDTYLFGKGDGSDFLYSDTESYENEINTLQFKPGVSPDEVVVRLRGTSLYFEILGTGDSVVLAYLLEGFSDQANQNEYPGLIKNVKFEDGTVWDLAKIIEKAQSETAEPDRIWGTDAVDVLRGGAGDDDLWGFGGNDQIDGDDGNDYINGGQGDDLLSGGNGDDLIYGYSGDDIIDGGPGNDQLAGETGSNTYRFGLGDGQDQIVLSCRGTARRSDANVLEFKPGINPDDIVITRRDWDLIVSFSGASDSITIGSFFYVLEGHADQTYSLVNQFKFENGVSWDLATIVGKIPLSGGGTDADDHLMGDASDNTFDGGAGNDKIYGFAGDDTLYGGAGDDELVGEEGADWLSGGDGNDRLDGGNGDDQVFGDSGDDRLFGGGGNDHLEGGDGNDSLVGGFGNDHLMGGAGDDDLSDKKGQNVFDGGQGNDQLYGGGSGKDIFMFGRGDGQDLIGAGQVRLSEVHFKPGVAPSDIEVIKLPGNDLILSIRGTQDQIRLDHFFESPSSSNRHSPVASVVFSDGTIWDLATINALASQPVGNRQPVVNNAPYQRQAQVGQQLIYQVPDDVFFDPDEGDSLVLSAHDLPSWLTFDAAQNTFAGVPPESAEGIFSFTLMATDSSGASTQQSVRFEVLPADPVPNGSDADDVIAGNDLANVIAGFGGDDTIHGHLGDDTLSGGAGRDTLYGDEGDDTLNGDEGNDTLLGADGDDQMTGGAGNDFLRGEAGDDTYHFTAGDGQDTIDATDVKSANDTLRLHGISASQVRLLQSNGHLFLQISGGDQIALYNYFAADSVIDGEAADAKIDRIVFDNGDIWDQAAIAQKLNAAASNQPPTLNNGLPPLNAMAGTPFSYVIPADTITDPDAGDSITYSVTLQGGAALPSWLSFDPVTRTLFGTPTVAQAGNLNLVIWGTDNHGYSTGLLASMAVAAGPAAPASGYTYDYTMPTGQGGVTVSGNAPYNIKGNSSANTITGNDGANVLNGAAGDDTLIGGKGADTYLMESGTGIDTIVEDDNSVGVTDILQWGNGVTNDQLWFRRMGDSLEISVIGTPDKAVIKDWYVGDANKVEQIWVDNKRLAAEKVQALVDAMEALTPPTMGQTTLPTDYAMVLEPVIAASWVDITQSASQKSLTTQLKPAMSGTDLWRDLRDAASSFESSNAGAAIETSDWAALWGGQTHRLINAMAQFGEASGMGASESSTPSIDTRSTWAPVLTISGLN